MSLWHSPREVHFAHAALSFSSTADVEMQGQEVVSVLNVSSAGLALCHAAMLTFSMQGQEKSVTVAF